MARPRFGPACWKDSNVFNGLAPSFGRPTKDVITHSEATMTQHGTPHANVSPVNSAFIFKSVRSRTATSKTMSSAPASSHIHKCFGDASGNAAIIERKCYNRLLLPQLAGSLDLANLIIHYDANHFRVTRD
jgi:hypothetical protein